MIKTIELSCGELIVRFKETKIGSVAEYLNELKKRKKLSQPIWYRGQEVADWHLEPTISRANGGITAEPTLITRFKQNALSLLEQQPKTEWEWLFVMRHHGIPTRLLDWSESPLVALYFSVCSEPNSDGSIWMLLPIALNMEANIQQIHPSEIPGFDDDPVLNNYLPSTLAQEQRSSLFPAAAIASRNTRRIQAQHGVFTISHRDKTFIEEIGNKRHVWRIIIPKNKKNNIMNELSFLNIDKLSLFPELDNVAKHATELVG